MTTDRAELQRRLDRRGVVVDQLQADIERLHERVEAAEAEVARLQASPKMAVTAPGSQVVTDLCNAIHVYRCGDQPDHGPYVHEDEATFYAGVAYPCTCGHDDCDHEPMELLYGCGKCTCGNAYWDGVTTP